MSKTQLQPLRQEEQAAVRKVIYSMAELTGEEVDPDEEHIIETANRAVENVTGLVDRVEELERRLDDLEARAPTPAEKEYAEMDRSDKARVVRGKLVNTAEATNDRASMTYKDVVSTFDGQPSPGHAYDIMAETAELFDGVVQDTNHEGDKRIRLNLRA
jgi:hypothetical protein